MLNAVAGHELPCVRDAPSLRDFITAAKKLVAAVNPFLVKSSDSGSKGSPARARASASSDEETFNESYFSCFLVRKLLLHELAHGREARKIDWSTVTVQDLKSLCPDQTGALDTVPGDWSAEAISNFFHGRSDWGVFVSCYACLLHELCERDRGSIETRPLAGNEGAMTGVPLAVMRPSDRVFSWSPLDPFFGSSRRVLLCLYFSVVAFLALFRIIRFRWMCQLGPNSVSNNI